MIHSFPKSAKWNHWSCCLWHQIRLIFTVSDTFWPLSLSSNFVSEITTLAETLQFCLQQMKQFNWLMVEYKTWIPAEPEFMERTRFEWFCHTSLSGVNQNRAPGHKGKIKGQSRIIGLDLKWLPSGVMIIVWRFSSRSTLKPLRSKTTSKFPPS